LWVEARCSRGVSLRERNWRHGHRDRIVVAGMADVEGAVVCVVTGIRRGGLRCVVFLVLSDIWEASIATNSLQWSPVVIH